MKAVYSQPLQISYKESHSHKITHSMSDFDNILVNNVKFSWQF